MEVQSTPYDTLTSVFGKSFFAQINFRDDEFLPSYGWVWIMNKALI